MRNGIIFILTVTFVLFLSHLSSAYAQVPYSGGYYTNLCGSGAGGTTDTCNGGCDPNTGTCTSDKPLVVRYSCNGKQVTCRNNTSKFEKTQNLTGASCGTTVELDVYKKNCQTIFGWFCNDSDRIDYMTWYAGDCDGQPTTPELETPVTGAPQASDTACTNLSVTGGNNSRIPATVTLQASGSQSTGNIHDYLFYFGDGQTEESAQSQITHQYQTSGTFTARVFIKNPAGNWITSPSCQTKVTVTGSSLETQKSACSNLFILSGNYTRAPTNVTFQVTGYDNKNSVKNYRVDLGNGQVKESVTDTITAYYPIPGTYVVRGYVLDGNNQWQGANETCVRTLYVSSQPLTQQPDTGTPTIFTIIALICGMTGFTLVLNRVHTILANPRKKHRTNHR